MEKRSSKLRGGGKKAELSNTEGDSEGRRVNNSNNEESEMVKMMKKLHGDGGQRVALGVNKGESTCPFEGINREAMALEMSLSTCVCMCVCL